MMEHPEVREILGPPTEADPSHSSLPAPTQVNDLHGEASGRRVRRVVSKVFQFRWPKCDIAAG